MGVRGALAKLAERASPGVFAVAGLGAREAVQDLRLSSGLHVAETPAGASILLVVGAIPAGLSGPLARIHDMLPHPRCTVWWRPGSVGALFPDAWGTPVIVNSEDVTAVLEGVQRELVTGGRPSERPIRPDVDPVPWRGVGPYGQGGTAMTGGTPYGRPMAELGPDRDGLRLDVLPLNVGPFFPRFPVGLVLDLHMAGDVVQAAAVGPNPFLSAESAGDGLRPGLRPFFRALSEPVPIAELELTRAREHLRSVADALVAHGLRRLGERVLRMAQRVGPGEGAAIQRLARWLRWTQATGWATRGVGLLAADDLRGLGLGPVARAAGLPEDARKDNLVYQELGFEPVVGREGDAAARLYQRLAEAGQSLDLAARAGARMSVPDGTVESPRGRLAFGNAPAERILARLPDLLRDMEWGDAVATIVSLDIDLEEAAAATAATVGAGSR